MITKVLSKIFGTKNERELKTMRPLVHQINLLEEQMLTLTEPQFLEKTNEFRELFIKRTTNDQKKIQSTRY